MTTTTTEYVAIQYAPDGHGALESPVVARGSLSDVRRAVARCLGYTSASEIPASQRWHGEAGDVEAYHDYPYDHPAAYGCGGYAIRKGGAACEEPEMDDEDDRMPAVWVATEEVDIGGLATVHPGERITVRQDRRTGHVVLRFPAHPELNPHFGPDQQEWDDEAAWLWLRRHKFVGRREG
jgi:hypothetical protein